MRHALRFGFLLTVAPSLTPLPALADVVGEASEAAQINVNVAGAGSSPMAPEETAGAPGVNDDHWANLAGTTTAAGPIQVLAAGRRLLLKDDPRAPRKRALLLLAKDPAIGLGAENGSDGDPVVHGGFLKVVSSTGDGFNTTYDLPADRWRYKGKEGRSKGYKLKGAGPIRKVLVKLGKTLEVVAKGDALGHTLGADPEPVHVALGLGAERYCFTFGGQAKFKAGKAFVAKKAAAPGVCMALVPSCGDALPEPGERCPLLQGPADGLAIDAVHDMDAGDGVTADEVSLDAAGRPIARTQLEVAFTPTATVGDVNALLEALDASIVSMLEGVLILVIRVPDPGSLEALDTLVTDIERAAVVRWVLPAGFDEPALLPENYTASSVDLPRLDHHLAVRAHAAWNARAALVGNPLSRPLVVVGDFFGMGPPGAATDVIDIDADYGTGALDRHGYHVLGIIAARFGGPVTSSGLATGIVAATTDLRVADVIIDTSTTRTSAQHQNLMLQHVRAAPGNVVLNTSLQFGCRTPATVAANCNPDTATRAALAWVEKVRGTAGLFGGTPSLEGKFLHVTAAGNVAVEGDTDARVASAYAAAKLLPLFDASILGTPTLVPPLTNVVVIENVVNTSVLPFKPACLSAGSKRSGDLAGIGTDVWSLVGPNGPGDDLSGTSMATPQVAGVAAAVWTLRPTLSPQGLRALLADTSRHEPDLTDPRCALDLPQPVVDAYAAVLAADRASALAGPAIGGAPARRAILDVADSAGNPGGDGVFDEGDVERFLHEFDMAQGALDYSRYDLNGDGATGGTGTERLDLDINDPPVHSTVIQDVEGTPLPFDETALTDLAVLCYYAYSSLYDGDDDARRELLGLETCTDIEMQVSFSSTITPGTPETLRVSVGRAGATTVEPLANVHIELSPSGGTAIPSNGLTDQQGEFSAQVMLDMGSAFVEVTVQALTEPDGAVLAEKVVSAGAPCTDAPSEVELDFGTGEPDPTVAGPTLQHGAEYRITVSGTYSIWTSEWQNGVCKGAPGAGEGGPTGLDAEYWFAIPVGSALCAESFQCCPNHTSKFRMSLDDGGSFAHIEPVVRDYNPAHVYEYRVRGQGLPVHFMLRESSARGDDYGILRMHIACASDSTTTTTSSTTSSTTTTTTSTSTTTTPTSTSTTTPSSSTTTTTIFGTPVVPYAAYAATGPDGPVVMLADEFVTETVDLGAVTLQLPPVAIDGDLPFDPDTHQTCYAHPGGVLDACIDIQNRFESAPLRVGNPVALCVPELFPAVAVDAFKCYVATGAPLHREVELVDGFQSQTVVVGAPELLCTPVEVDGDPLVNAGRYLVCYATAPPGTAGGQIEVENALHASPIEVDVGSAIGLCVPALRQLVATCDLCGNGVLDGDEECDDGNLTDGDGCSAVCRFEGACTCDGVPMPPPDDAGCATLADCTASCSTCTAGGGSCGCG